VFAAFLPNALILRPAASYASEFAGKT
jgi:hypothetical protein